MVELKALISESVYEVEEISAFPLPFFIKN